MKVEVIVRCECGCGSPLEQYSEAVALRGEGLSHWQIGERLGVSRKHITQILNKPPRFVVGHAAKKGPVPRLDCRGCGRSFASHNGRTYCRWEFCSKLWLFAQAGFSDVLLNGIQNQHDAWLLVQSTEYELARERHRTERLRARQKARSQARMAREARRHESRLRERDADLISVGKMRSLFAPLAKFRDSTLSLADVLEDASGDPAILAEERERMRELNTLLGGRSYEEVQRLSGPTLDHLRRQLSDAGFTPRGLRRFADPEMTRPQHRKPKVKPELCEDTTDGWGAARSQGGAGRSGRKRHMSNR